MAILSGGAELVLPLLEAGCPVDGRLIAGLAGARRVQHRGLRVALTGLFGSMALAYRCGRRTPFVVGFSQCEGLTPLMLAAMLGRRDVAGLLRAQGADAALTSRNGFTAADWARLFGQPADFVAELR